MLAPGGSSSDTCLRVLLVSRILGGYHKLSEPYSLAYLGNGIATQLVIELRSGMCVIECSVVSTAIQLS